MLKLDVLLIMFVLKLSELGLPIAGLSNCRV